VIAITIYNKNKQACLFCHTAY